MPKKSHLTKLIIKQYHECTKHQGKGMTLNEIGSRGYWIIAGSSAVSTVIASCVTCKKLRGPVIEQRMADLSEDRLESAPPFTYCAGDYFGPFMVKEKRKEIKRYGVIFTCMASTAILLEIANSLDTDSFLNAFRRFTSRRGPVRQLRSDQGNGPRKNQVKPVERTMRLDHLQDECTVGKPHGRRVGTPDTNGTERALILFTTQLWANWWWILQDVNVWGRGNSQR